MTALANIFASGGRALSPAEIAISRYLSDVHTWVERRLDSLPPDAPESKNKAQLMHALGVLDSPIDFNAVTADDLYQRLEVAWMFLAWENPKEVIEKFVRERTSNKARRAADARHDQKGGTRDKHRRLLAIWASGKYRTKDECAHEECEALGMAPTTARKALINAPGHKRSST
jgi:hypothetical protein